MMRLRELILASAFAIGFSSAASAAPLTTSASQPLLSPDTVVEFTKWKAKHAWKGNRGRHYGWKRGRHLGWYKKARHRGAYYR